MAHWKHSNCLILGYVTYVSFLQNGTHLVTVDRSVATVGGVSIVLSSATVLDRVSLATLQSDNNKPP